MAGPNFKQPLSAWSRVPPPDTHRSLPQTSTARKRRGLDEIAIISESLRLSGADRSRTGRGHEDSLRRVRPNLSAAAHAELVMRECTALPDVRRQKVHGDGPRLACVPSYRMELEIGALRPRRAPEEVMDAAVASLGSLHVDATDLQVSDGAPFIFVRFTVPAASETEEDRAAGVAARRMRDAVGRIADTGRLRLLRRRGGDWVPIN